MDQYPKIIGKSPHIKKLLEFIKKVANTDKNVLLLGDTGVGKELAARMIHSYSERKKSPFIKVNCSNLNENLLESELFGYRKGAYTGAIFDRPGLIEEADGGTFFLDEIADTNSHLQAKLLNVIEEKELRRLGENYTRKIDIRFILATNKDLSHLMMKGEFRKDLYYRISILTFYIPPLRDRKKDISLLLKEILRKENEKTGLNKKFSQKALDKLLQYHYPGNIRELENIVYRAYVFSNSDEIGEKDVIMDEILLNRRKELKANPEQIKKALKKYKGNKSRVAKEIGISRQWLYKIINNKT